MHEINWARFILKNPNPQDAFETMCRNIFLREYKVSSHRFSANYNQTGLETEPVLYDGKYYGFQCKYSTSGNNDAFYKEVLDSLSKAVAVYPNLYKVVVYTNLDIKPNVSAEELSKSKKTNRVRIHDLCQQNNLEICWFVKANFENSLNEVRNYDLYRAFFSPQDTTGMLSNALSHDERTFLLSNRFVDLPLNGSRFSELKDEILACRISIITGAAGTGKSEILKKLYLQCENRYLLNTSQEASDVDTPIPVFVRLRECVNGNLEELLRSRLRDYEISAVETQNQYIYFLDGLDEVSTFDFGGVIACISRLLSQAASKSFVITSRTNNANLASVLRSFKPDIYTVDCLDGNDVEEFFNRLNDPEKKARLQEIKDSNQAFFGDINDIFSAVLLSENAFNIDASTTKVDLISMNAEKLVESNHKYALINLPEPKVLSVEKVLAQVSEFMQRTGNISVSRSDLQGIVAELFPSCSYLQIDDIIEFIAEMFFDSVRTNTLQTRYSYRHKRYFEFYLYVAVRNAFYENPGILREQRLLSNKDFMLNIFLIQELKINTISSNVQRVLALRFLEAYLGDDYLGDSQSPWFMSRSLTTRGSDSYMQSEPLQEYLCTKHIEDLRSFLKTDPLSIKGFLTSDNYYAFVKRYHKAHGMDIRPLLDETYNIQEPFLKKAIEKDRESHAYCMCVIDQVPIEKFFSVINVDLDVKNIDLDYYHPHFHNELSMVIDFFNLAIDNYSDWLLAHIAQLSVQHLEVLSYVLLQPHHLGSLIVHDGSTLLAAAIKDRVIAGTEEQYGINTVVLYGILSGAVIQKADLEARTKEVNVNHLEQWRKNFALNSYAGMLLGDEFRPWHYDYMLGVSLRRIVHELYPREKHEILPRILQEVNRYNLVHRNWFSYKNAIFIGEILSTLDIDSADKKRFLIELRKYDSVVSTFQVLNIVMQRNSELFIIIANPSLLAAEYVMASRDLSYYEFNSDLHFTYAVMMSHFDVLKADALFENAINASIFRPLFRHEDMIDYHLPNCLLTAYHNYWFSSEELEYALRRIYGMLEIAKSTLDGGADKEHFRFVVEKCCPYLLDVLDEITVTADSPERTMGWESFTNKVSSDGLTLDNLPKYYCCEVEGINYSSVLVWKDLIQFEMMRDSELTVLYDTLDKNYYPNSGFSKISHCFPIVTAVLLSNPHTRTKALEFLMKRAGRMGLVTLIKAYGLIGDDQSGRQCIEQLIRLCEAMVYPSTEHIENVSISKNRDWEIINKVCDSKIGDWNCEEKECIMHFIPNPKIIIKWDPREDMEPFSEDWATRYPNKDAYSITYYICYEQEIIKVFDMVYVDGSRALIPMPDYLTKHIDRISYQFACLVNCNVQTLNGYIRSSGLVVD